MKVFHHFETNLMFTCNVWVDKQCQYHETQKEQLEQRIVLLLLFSTLFHK